MYTTIQKTIAAWAFNHYIAYYYFDNVNVNQLTVAFERGEVELEDLPIKKDALKHLNLPLDVLSGVVGKLSIKVPLLTLLTDPWLIKITNLVLIVAPRKHQVNNGSSTDTTSAHTPLVKNKNSHNSTQAPVAGKTTDSCEKQNDPTTKAKFEPSADLPDLSSIDNLDNISLLDESDTYVTAEETKLAEFYSSFSASVSAMVRDIHKNLKLEIESMTILFEDFDQGLMKFSVGNLLLHRPKSARNLVINDVSIYLSSAGIPSIHRGDDLIRLCMERCVLDIHDEASKSMQIVLVQTNQDSVCKQSLSPSLSETNIEGTMHKVSIERLTGANRNISRDNLSSLPKSDKSHDGIKLNKRDILNCDLAKFEFKYSTNRTDNSDQELDERNLHIKLDLLGLQYIHSQRIYEITMQRLNNLLKLFKDLSSKAQNHSSRVRKDNSDLSGKKALIERREEVALNKLLNINIEDGILYIVDDSSGSCAIPLLEFSLEDLRIFQFSEKHEQNGFIYAKAGCNYYNRATSSWNAFIQAWPFNISWDLKSASSACDTNRKYQHRTITLNSDELANITISSGLLDLGHIAFRRILNDIIHPRFWPLQMSLDGNAPDLSTYFNSVFVLHNETGHRLYFLPLEENEISEVRDSGRSSAMDEGGDSFSHDLTRKSSTHSRRSTTCRDSPDLVCITNWVPVEPGAVMSFEFTSSPIYRKQASELINNPRAILVRVDGWKTLCPISIDKTGLFFRKACADRVINMDTDFVVSVDLEQSTARKIITVRSPLNLVNQTDVTLEVQFVESNQALYIKPNAHQPVPLPLLSDSMHVRPCNVGVTISKQALVWDRIQRTSDQDSRIYICHPLAATDQKHSSYCSSQPYRLCVATRRESQSSRSSDVESVEPTSVFALSFLPPLTIVNLLPYKLDYTVDENNKGSIEISSQHKLYKVDTTKPTTIYFRLPGFPRSKAIHIEPGATGSFHQTLEMYDTKNRSLFLDADIVIASDGEEPAVQVVIYARYWIMNKTDIPIIFKQEGAALEAAGQFAEHEYTASPILLFSFYELELELPWLCSMRIGKSKGSPTWCDGFKLEKGKGERRLCTIPKTSNLEQRINKILIDIEVKRGYGRYSISTIITLTKRYGFDPLTKTPKKSSMPSPQNYKLSSYNHNANLAGRIAGQAVDLFNRNQSKKVVSDLSLRTPGFRVSLQDSHGESFSEVYIKDIDLKCTTSMRAKEQILDCTVGDIKVYNCLEDCEKCLIVDRASTLDDSLVGKPAVRLIMDRVLGNSYNSAFFRQVQLSMCDLVMNIEEKLVLKFIEFISFRNRRQAKNLDNLTDDLDKILNPDDDRRSKYYFDLLCIDLSSLKLSVFSSYDLPSSLQRLKSHLGLKFFGFEDAQVELAAYTRMHVSKTFKGVFESVTRFYKQQIFEQAPRIVGQQIQNYLRFHLSDLLSTLYDEVYHKLFN